MIAHRRSEPGDGGAAEAREGRVRVTTSVRCGRDLARENSSYNIYHRVTGEFRAQLRLETSV